MKKILSFLLALVLLLSVVGCAPAMPEGYWAETSAAEADLQLIEDTGPSLTQATAPETETAAQTEAAAPESEAPEAETEPAAEPTAEPEPLIDENGQYDSKEDVALYIHLYGHLPSNYITKREAERLGWNGGSLEPYAPGCCIGGSHFGNYEGLLPEANGRSYTECDIGTIGKRSRGAKRIVFSNDGLIFYTDDHYESFELLYGEVEGW